jgi:copper resistance protein D
MSPEAALDGCHFLRDASAMALWGALAFLWLLAPAGLAQDIERRLRVLLLALAVVAVATTAAGLPLAAASIGEGWPDAVAPAMLRDVLLDTSLGHAWQVEAAAALLLLAATFAPRPLWPKAGAIASGLLLASFALTGHAAMRTGWLGTGQRLNDAIHLLSAGAWFGALAPLLLALRALDAPCRRQQAGIALRRFSRMGHAAVLLVIASGLINTALILGCLPTRWTSPYQALLAVKCLLVLAMIGFAVLNRYGFAPRMARHPASAAAAIRIGAMTEIALALGVIGLASVFGMLEPV